jgi:hypothetical protein
MMASARVGDIVLYRNREGVDMPAIITALLPADEDGVVRDVHLHVFVPPGEAPDQISHQFGAHLAEGHSESGMWLGTWRPRETSS